MHTVYCSRALFQRMTKLAAPAIFGLLIATSAVAQLETTIHTFAHGTGGAQPESALVADSAGNLYGTATEGGGSANCVAGGEAVGCGTVFELGAPANGSGHWTETTLYAFQGGTTDGAIPSAPLVFDAAGNLYGTTTGGGQSYGTIFKLSPPSSPGGLWTETVLYNFGFENYPTSGLAIDSEGNLFGEATTLEQVYELSPPSTSGGAWTFTTLHAFNTEDGGENAIGGLALDKSGNIYGASITGGNGMAQGCPVDTCGLVFKLIRPVTGSTWKEEVLYKFTGQNGDGASPQAGVIFHGDSLYGTTFNGGNGSADGTVFELSPPTVEGGSWTETTLYDFSPTGGHDLEAGVVFDAKGNLYSTLYYGLSGGGEAFELSPPTEPGSPWIFTDLFDSNCGDDGCNMNTALLVGKTGDVYGTTRLGGAGNLGVVFGIIP